MKRLENLVSKDTFEDKLKKKDRQKGFDTSSRRQRRTIKAIINNDIFCPTCILTSLKFELQDEIEQQFFSIKGFLRCDIIINGEDFHKRWRRLLGTVKKTDMLAGMSFKHIMKQCLILKGGFINKNNIPRGFLIKDLEYWLAHLLIHEKLNFSDIVHNIYGLLTAFERTSLKNKKWGDFLDKEEPERTDLNRLDNRIIIDKTNLNILRLVVERVMDKNLRVEANKKNWDEFCESEYYGLQERRDWKAPDAWGSSLACSTFKSVEDFQRFASQCPLKTWSGKQDCPLMTNIENAGAPLVLFQVFDLKLIENDIPNESQSRQKCFVNLLDDFLSKKSIFFNKVSGPAKCLNDALTREMV